MGKRKINLLPDNLPHIFIAERLNQRIKRAARGWPKAPYTREKITFKKLASFVPLDFIVYARHGRELMGLKSPVSVPCNVLKRNINY